MYPQTNFLVPHMYTNNHIHKHSIIQLTGIHLVHTCSIYKFGTVDFWSLKYLSANWWSHQKIIFLNYSSHTWTYSVLVVFKNSCNILGSSLYIWCPNSQKLFLKHYPVGMFQWNPIGVPLIFYWNNMLGNISEFSLMMLGTRCIQSYTYFLSLLLPQFTT